MAELNLSALFARHETSIAFVPLPRYPAVSRDLSLVVPRGRLYGEIEEAARAAAGARLIAVRPTDVYRGPGLADGTYGLSINLVYQSAEGTMSSDEINTLQERVVAALALRCGAALRHRRKGRRSEWRSWTCWKKRSARPRRPCARCGRSAAPWSRTCAARAAKSKNCPPPAQTTPRRQDAWSACSRSAARWPSGWSG